MAENLFIVLNTSFDFNFGREFAKHGFEFGSALVVYSLVIITRRSGEQWFTLVLEGISGPHAELEATTVCSGRSKTTETPAG